MSTTSKNKILMLVVIILLLTNVAMLVFFLNRTGPDKKGPHGGREAMVTEFLQKEVGFDQQQMQQYDTLNKQHKEQMKAAFDSMRKNKEVLYKQLGNAAFNDSAINTTAAGSVEIQKGMEMKMLLHFREIRKLCTPAQQPKFDSLFYKVWEKKGDNRKKLDK